MSLSKTLFILVLVLAQHRKGLDRTESVRWDVKHHHKHCVCIVSMMIDQFLLHPYQWPLTPTISMALRSRSQNLAFHIKAMC